MTRSKMPAMLPGEVRIGWHFHEECMAVGVHNKILQNAGRELLDPLGIHQRGRSRKWLDDHGWWLVNIEFQPSSWARGSYLNVGAMWLWRDQDYFSFDLGHRIAGRIEFKNEEQFTAAARQLAEKAAAEATRLRNLFPDIQSVADHLRRETDRSEAGWPAFNTGVACGLAGDVRHARQFLSRFADSDDDRDWAIRAAKVAAQYETLVEDTAAFRQRIAQIIRTTRSSLKLEPRPDPEWAGASR